MSEVDELIKQYTNLFWDSKWSPASALYVDDDVYVVLDRQMTGPVAITLQGIRNIIQRALEDYAQNGLPTNEKRQRETRWENFARRSETSVDQRVAEAYKAKTGHNLTDPNGWHILGHYENGKPKNPELVSHRLD